MLKPEPGPVSGPLAAEERALRVIVCGEISSGKSTVINTLLRGNLIPNYMGSAWRPPVLVRHGAAPALYLKYRDGRTERVTSLDVERGLEEISQCIVQTDAPHLKGFEIIEMPFFHDGEVLDEALSFMASADILIWVTIASQAWRLTEKTVMDRLGARRPNQSVLVVSRADKLRNARDTAKIRERVERETAGYFRHVTFLSGARSMIERTAGSEEAWARTAGQELLGVIAAQAAEIRSMAPDGVPEAEPGFGSLPPHAQTGMQTVVQTGVPVGPQAGAMAVARPDPAQAEVVDLASWRTAAPARRDGAEPVRTPDREPRPQDRAPERMAEHLPDWMPALPAAPAPRPAEPARGDARHAASEPADSLSFRARFLQPGPLHEPAPALEPAAHEARVLARVMARTHAEPDPVPRTVPVGAPAARAPAALAPVQPEADGILPGAASAGLRLLVGSIRGFVSVGLARMEEAPETLVLAGEAGMAEAVAEFCRTASARHRVALEAALDADSDIVAERIETVVVVMRDHSLLYQVLPQAGLVIFALSGNGQINTGVARTSMARLSRAVAGALNG